MRCLYCVEMTAEQKTVAFAAAGLLAYNLFTKGRALGTLNFYPAEVSSVRFDGLTPVVTLGLAVQNTSGQQMILRSFAGNVFANGYLIGNVASYTPTAIRANGESRIFVTARFSILGLVNDIIEAITTKNFKQTFELSAFANVNNFQIPVKIKYSVGE